MATRALTVTYVLRSIASSPAIFTLGSFPLRSASARVGSASFSRGFLCECRSRFPRARVRCPAIIYRRPIIRPYRPPLSSQSGQTIRFSAELYKSFISRTRSLIFDIANLFMGNPLQIRWID